MGMAVLDADATVASVGMVGLHIVDESCNHNETLNKPSSAELPCKQRLVGKPLELKAGHGGVGA